MTEPSRLAGSKGSILADVGELKADRDRESWSGAVELEPGAQR